MTGVLNVGLTGGIGAGKSAVSARLAHRGAVIVDSDVLAREVVAPGTPGLSEVVDVFGVDVLDGSGALNRAALAARIFDDSAARARLEAIIHPRVRSRSEDLTKAAPSDAVVVNDIPLLAEVGLAPAFDLVIVVTAPRDLRLRRLAHRGLPTAQAEARIAAQAPDQVRAAVADVIISNAAGLSQLYATVDDLHGRMRAFEANKRHQRAVTEPTTPDQLPYDPHWPGRFNRLAARLRALLAEKALHIDHIGATAVPGLSGRDIIDVQVTVADDATAVSIRSPLTEAGFPPLPADASAGATPGLTYRHGGTDPGNVVCLHIVPVDSPAQPEAVALRDLLSGDATVRDEYAAVKAQPAAKRDWLTRTRQLRR
jgi:dephospho-CoA kinase